MLSSPRAGDQDDLMPDSTRGDGMMPHDTLQTCKQEIGQVHNDDVDKTTRNLISSAWRDSSKNSYAIYIKKYILFAKNRKFDLQPTEIQVANFLSSCFDKGLGYSAIKVARAAVSSIILFDFSQS